ncbi:hypothetical protein AAG570_009817 [Ranatra chinensis]|uniref:Complex 1 LYR protein domain-containing protein n=1 Tax=Ranatra chinensis TaxID=642074 RepID=A0ABD0YQ71_9HEMI
MTCSSPREVIGLYRRLLRYSRQLKYTSKGYFVNRIQTEFRKNQAIESKEEIKFLFEVNIPFFWRTNLGHNVIDKRIESFKNYNWNQMSHEKLVQLQKISKQLLEDMHSLWSSFCI